jgi:chloramphenicol 3-O phosphotransferase
MSEVQIILLNGPTCVGKTAIAQLIQEKSAVARAHMQIDTFVAMLPKRYVTPPCPNDRPSVIAQLRHGFHSSIASMASQGNRLIVDTVRAEPGWLDEWLEVFKPFSVLFVGVFADLEDLEQREAERQRPDDLPGTARRHFHTVHQGDVYDIRLDTSRQSPEECADRVMEFLQSDRSPVAFDQLREERREQNSQQDASAAR